MTTRVVSVDMDCPLAEVQRLFETHGFHHLVVVNNGRLVGVISDRDLLRAVSPFVGTASERSCDEHTLKKRAHQIMSRRPVSCEPETLVYDAARCMLENGINCLPAINPKGRCVGMITVRDLARWAMTELEIDIPSVDSTADDAAEPGDTQEQAA